MREEIGLELTKFRKMIFNQKSPILTPDFKSESLKQTPQHVLHGYMIKFKEPEHLTMTPINGQTIYHIKFSEGTT